MKKLILVLCIIVIALSACNISQKSTFIKAQKDLIASWEYQVEIYEKYKDSDKSGELQFAEDAKMKANEIAQEYNEAMAKNDYLFNGTYPEGIYAAIEPFE